MGKEEPRPIKGARALLFDRLTDHDPYVSTEAVPLRVFTRDEVRQSVRRELGRLLNTRCPVPAHELQGRERTVLEYGLPDFTSLSPQSSTDRKKLAASLSRTIAFFEPRLRNVSITVEEVVGRKTAVRVRLDAALVIDTVMEPVSFPLLIQIQQGQAEVDDEPG